MRRTAAMVLGWMLVCGCGQEIVDGGRMPAGRTWAGAELLKSERLVPDHGLDRFSELALDCVDREYPNKIAHTLQGDGDIGTPSDLHPAFFGCFDWHSSVHGHWLLARAYFSDDPRIDRDRIRDVLDRHLAPAPIAAEVAYMEAEGRGAWERPYGLAWLLQLATELRLQDHDDARRWAAALRLLEDLCAERLLAWLPKLAYPIRTGEHSQTAFSLGLALDYARTAGRKDLALLIEAKARAFHLDDRAADLAYEPSGQDFLSPILAEADLMARVLDTDAFTRWLDGFLPDLPRGHDADWLPVARVTDRRDGKLAHLDGLNLSRAWMLDGIAASLLPGDGRRAALTAAADGHARDALAALTGEHYAGGHWLGTYAAYLDAAPRYRGGSEARAAVVALREDLWRGDQDAAVLRLSEDPRRWWERRRGEGQPWVPGRGRWVDWDEVFRSRNRILWWDAEVEDGSAVRVSCVVEEMNDYFALIGRGPLRYRQVYWFDPETRKMDGTLVQNLREAAPVSNLGEEFVIWAKEHHSETLAEIMPGGRIDPTGDRPARMRGLLETWRREQALPAIE